MSSLSSSASSVFGSDDGSKDTPPSCPGSPISETKAVEDFIPRLHYDEDALPRIPKGDYKTHLETNSQTPDAWVARDARMIRLTGQHPYNVEAPLRTLFDHGFLTPQNLFYVRTHGNTPQVSRQQASEWRLRVHGLVEREIDFTIGDLQSKFPTVTLPVTVVCAGNRRKEQNMVMKGLGFNWGAAGVSTGLFTGVYLADILEYCKPRHPLCSAYPSYDTVVPGRARHVVFEGADELPKGKYGTSQRLNWAMDRDKGMIIAWGLNGEDLSPDHGYPLRLIVPGQIGGRMVKWLQRIEVSDRESQHHLHFFDNKLLPTQVTADQARSETKWWYDPKYIINDLNVNAAMCSPAHDEVVDGIIEAAGYAYTGGGRRVSRVEVSIDDGHSWQLADIEYPEDLYRQYPIRNHPYFGKLDLSMTEMSFSWCFWRLKLDITNGVNVISVRAMDEALSTMPRDMYWNAMSMMNSWWFRVATRKEPDGLRLEYPTLAGTAQGGWMQRIKNNGISPRYPSFGDEAKTEELVPKTTTESEVDLILDPSKTDAIAATELAAHIDSAWFVVHGHVFDGSRFFEDHPGGDQSIKLVAGMDATEDFMAIHSIDAKRMLRDYHIGKLDGTIAPPTVVEESDSYLIPQFWKKTRLVSKREVSHDSRIFRFALNHDDQELGLPAGQHVFLRVKKPGGQFIQRAYTPYSGNTQRGFLDILIKVYFPRGSSPGGSMTMALENASNDLEIELKGPFGHFTYLGNNEVRIGSDIRQVDRLIMLAAGSGITPMWTTLKAIADEKGTPPELRLVCGNKKEVDILLRDELDNLARQLKTMSVSHILSDATTDWTMSRGRIDLGLIRDILPAASAANNTLVLLCGPPAMEAAVLKALKELRWDKDSIVQF